MNGELDQNDTAPNDAPGHDARVAYYTVQNPKKEKGIKTRNVREQKWKAMDK
jgi:hypothetical protein